MPSPVVGLVGAIGGGLYAANRAQSAQTEAATEASEAQIAASEAAIEEQRRQFDTVVDLMRPYVDIGAAQLDELTGYTTIGQPALQRQIDLIGLGEEGAQEAAIQDIRESERFQALQDAGEEAILSRAAATGGLRGGRTQGALAQFAPALLQDEISRQLNQLGGLTALGLGTSERLAGLGQAAAAGQAAAGQQTAGQIGNLLTQQGQATAGAELAKGSARSQFAGQFGNLLGTGLGLGIGGF